MTRFESRERLVTCKGLLYCIILILILILIPIFQRCNKRVKGSLQAARLDLYVNGEILSPSDDKRLISQVPLRDRTVSMEVMKLQVRLCSHWVLKSELILRDWLIERGIFIIIISAFLLGVKANLFCVIGL